VCSLENHQKPSGTPAVRGAGRSLPGVPWGDSVASISPPKPVRARGELPMGEQQRRTVVTIDQVEVSSFGTTRKGRRRSGLSI
jgi:hypothetical protein